MAENREVRAPLWRAGAVIGAAMVAVLIGASCSASTTTATIDRPASTIGRTQRPTTTRTSAPSTSMVTVADLEALLPSAADVGVGYAVDNDDQSDASDDSDDAVDQAMAEACPAAADLLDDSEKKADDQDTANRRFTTEDGRSIEVSLVPDIAASSTPDRAALRRLVAGIADCDTIRFESGGISFTATLSMKMDATYGDFGAVLEMQWRGESPQLPKPIVLNGVMRLFAVGSRGVEVSAFGGVDPETFEGIPADEDVVDRLARQLETEIAQLG